MESREFDIRQKAFTMMVRTTAVLALLLTAAPVVAQNQAPPAQGAQPAQDEGLSVTVTDENAWQDLQVAIPAFATDREAPTPANSQGTTALGLELARVIYNDLRNNALFKPTGPDSLPKPGYSEITAPAFGRS